MTRQRATPIEISQEEFKKMGYRLVDSIAHLFENIGNKPITSGETPQQLQNILGTGSLPENGRPPVKLLAKTTDLLFDHSLFNGHPKFMGYITGSPAPLGALADMLAAAVNPNVGAQILSPVATEIEKQTVKWLAELIGISPDCGGILVSGGNMANFTAFLAARTAKAPKSIKEEGLAHAPKKLTVYCSKTTHTWIEKASILFGHGANSVRWIQTDADNKMDNEVLRNTIANDQAAGHQPFMVVGTAGDVSTGTVDNLKDIAGICKQYDLWFHVDGAYGVPAAVIPELKKLFDGISEADSIALDPHKWLYNPLEVGCTLVKNPQHLTDAFSSHPEYYNFSDEDKDFGQNFYEYGPQNSRGFRALKVWLTLQQIGRKGYIEMISQDIELARLLFELAETHPELEAISHSLSITTLRYVPLELTKASDNQQDYLNTLNEDLLNVLQEGGEVFLSNAIVREKYCLRGCIVNFRTRQQDIEEIIDIVVGEGQKVHQKLQNKS